ncbi:LysM peptidoglycan-binding domain-containing protein [Sediminibacillus dalangtanensis]|uniref:LysM peptidoglycan-binding domain-containing protein n=1 Tax=Sediminibacillus dalangtanensis TaxID=2729421 RepID=A0ABX7VW72_9BACI|nr:glycoside hydrolase family 18 protein [Sediminibacillus dalangtanensis]QTN01225.1 LysM peptidoglycan-binding domain-containing protein [Sediminibacillus dalangtanensis]
MQIHVVAPGESLYAIAMMYGTTVASLQAANELDAPGNLVVGQALVVPLQGNIYHVQPGDSLYSIGQRFGLSVQQLANANNISANLELQVGFPLYIPQQPKTRTEVNAYIEPYGETVSETLINAAEKNTQYLTYLSPFSYQINRDGTLTPPPLDNFRQIAANNNAGLVLVVTNLEEGAFSAELGREILTKQQVENTLLNEIISTAEAGGYRDVHFDFEFLPPDTREDYNNFLRRTKRRLSEAGLMMSTALAPKTSAEQTGAWYEAHDYAAHGEIVDFVVLMTYEWGYSGGPPMAVSPIGPVREVVEYALTEMPAEKIMLGQNLYGYDWTLPFEPGGDYAEALSPQQAITLARNENVAIEYDETDQAPFFNYTDGEGNRHEVWFEDARSIQAKFDLIKELGLRGISYWKLGLAFPQNWQLLDANFTIVKPG